MKKYTLFIISCFLFLLVYFELDIIYSLFFRTHPNLNESYCLSSDYQNTKAQYEELSSKLELWHEENQIVSKVVLHDPYLFFDQVTILKGREENINIGDVVYDEVGYIGKIIETRRHSSIVELVTSSNTKMPVKVQNSYGVLQKEKDGLVVKNITSKEEITVGSIIETSEFSSITKKIPVAEVEEVYSTGVEQILKVKPLINVNNLNYCLIESSVSYD